jgi:hypothetical protein
MVEKRNRPTREDINHDLAPCSRCDHVIKKSDYGQSKNGRRLRMCPSCRQKDKNKESETLLKHLEIFNINDVIEATKTNTGDKTGTTIGIFGQSKIAGKTTLLKEIIKLTHNQFDFILIFTINNQASVYDDLKKYKNVRVSYKFDPLIVNAMHKINSEINKKERLNILFILDDEIDSKLSNTLRNMILTFRNMNISTIICSQAYSIVDKKSRGNFNFVFLGRFTTDEHIKDLTDIYLSSLCPIDFGKKHKQTVLTNFYREKTSDHRFLVINSLEDNFRVQQYKAKI